MQKLKLNRLEIEAINREIQRVQDMVMLDGFTLREAMDLIEDEKAHERATRKETSRWG